MAIVFLIGPAGSGKTHGCLSQIREALGTAPDGLPLLWVAPKQSTFQLERQVLALGVRGFTRLQILPFDRLARWVLAELGLPIRDVLSEEGRVMVLRALLLKRESELTAFRASARSAGFATQLSRVLRELQCGGVSSEQLRRLQPPGLPGASLAGKLHDLALLLEGYRQWLDEHRLRDPDDLLVLAAGALGQARKSARPVPTCAGLWLDGFAEMTLPEMDLLAALLPLCESATLAFCLERVPAPTAPLLPGQIAASSGSASLWGVTAATYLRCLDRIQVLGLATHVRRLPETGGATPRFKDSPALGHLASAWTGAQAESAGPQGGHGGVNLVECADPEAEALLAVRLINHHVRQGNGRYREISIIVRRMEGYGDVLQRAFRRHGIPCFADHREPMGHHPVAELTRSVLRMAASGWAHEDWLSALKTGLVVDNPLLVDNLENSVLRNGLHGDEWMRLEEYRARAGLSIGAVETLEKPTAAFRDFQASVTRQVDGKALAEALRTLWSGLDVSQTLERWQVGAGDLPPIYRAIHHTAWEQIGAWCDDLALAFADTELSARDWVTIAEAGLSRLTLGVIPPALDQVLVGAVDRARQPEAKLTIVLGLNEGVFPAAPASPALLNRVERQVLAEGGVDLGWGPLPQAARENYYAYIACTRSSERLCVAWSRRGFDGKTLVRSSVAERVLALVGCQPDQAAEPGDITAFDGRLKAFSGNPRPDEAGSLSELFECPGWDRALPATPSPDTSAVAGAMASHAARLRVQLKPDEGASGRLLRPDAVESLHPGGVLVSSVSALEDFAMCPFRHFAARRLRLDKRDEFKADAAGTGTLLHSILKEFHEGTLVEKGRWRSWSPEEAGDRVRGLGEAQLARPEFAPLVQDPLVAWETRRKVEGLAAMVAQLIRWMETCALDPVLSEFTFGDGADCQAPAWNLELVGQRTLKLRGRIDRIDACTLSGGRLLLAIFDYKSTAKPPSKARLEHGLELQLLGYLAFVTTSAELKRLVRPGAGASIEAYPGGAFYVPLAPRLGSSPRSDSEEERRTAFLDSLTHLGRGDKQWLEQFDSVAANPPHRWARSRQFKTGHFLGMDDSRALVENTTRFLKQHASEILDGTVAVHPVRFGANDSACDHCLFRSLCRFEPLLDDFRSLPPAGAVRDQAPGTPAADAD